MSILIVSPGRDPEAWIKALKEQGRELQVEVYPDVKDPEAIDFALSWKHPHGIFKNFPNLKAIASMGAGIDHITSDKTIPQHIQITRVVDEQLTRDMSVFVLSLVLEKMRNLSSYRNTGEWNSLKYQRPEEVRVGVMGLGVLGTATAKLLAKNKFKVAGWSASPKKIAGIKSFHSDEQLDAFLADTDFLVCLLPLTSETENILNKNLFSNLPEGAYIINVARGNHLVEEDLLEMLKKEHLSGASLDVFRQEPLPKNHPFWKHPRIRITPHIASVTRPSSVAPQIISNYERLQDGKSLQNLVDRQKEY